MDKTFDEWQSLAQSLQFEGRAFIDGCYRDVDDSARFDCFSPIDSRLLTRVTESSAQDVDAAVAAARRTFESGEWRGLSPRQRKAVLLRFARLVREDLQTLALIETLDAGKPIANTVQSDIPSVAYCIEWFAEAIDKVLGEVPSTDPYLLGLVTREPVGVVAAVVPWNFPLKMAAWKFAPALAAGNSVVLKPSEKSPLSALRVAALAHQAGIPAGVFNVLPGSGAVGHLLASHPDVDCIAFTGSTRVGREIMACAARSNLKRVWLELGGKSANIVLPDCPDLDQAVETAAGSIFYNAGQMCSAASRLLLHRDIADLFIEKLRDVTRTYRPGHPLNPATVMGAVIDAAQLYRVQACIDAGRRDAALLAGGDMATVEPGGHYLNPTLFEVSQPATEIARDEIFGPVLSIIRFDTIAEAVRIANASEYGLGAAVWTADLSTAHDVARRLRAGTVWVNCYEEGGDMNFPFGGFKQSGNGRDRSLHAFDKYTELKSTVIRLK